MISINELRDGKMNFETVLDYVHYSIKTGLEVEKPYITLSITEMYCEPVRTELSYAGYRVKELGLIKDKQGKVIKHVLRIYLNN